MDREIGVLLPYAPDKKSGCSWFENSSHVLDAEDMCPHGDDFVDEIQVVSQTILFLGVQHVAAVADRSLHNAACLLNSFYTDLKLVEIVKSVKNTEDVNAIDFSLLAEVVDGVIRKTKNFSRFS
jgi:hypothetical protein